MTDSPEITLGEAIGLTKSLERQYRGVQAVVSVLEQINDLEIHEAALRVSIEQLSEKNIEVKKVLAGSIEELAKLKALEKRAEDSGPKIQELILQQKKLEDRNTESKEKLAVLERQQEAAAASAREAYQKAIKQRDEMFESIEKAQHDLEVTNSKANEVRNQEADLFKDKFEASKKIMESELDALTLQRDIVKKDLKEITESWSG